MMNFSDIQRWARDLYAARYEPEGVRVLADIYWRGLLVGAVLIVILAIVWGVFDLFGVLDTLAPAPDNAPSPPPAFSRTTLQNVIHGFEAHQTQFNSLESTPLPKIVDPSK